MIQGNTPVAVPNSFTDGLLPACFCDLFQWLLLQKTPFLPGLSLFLYKTEKYPV